MNDTRGPRPRVLCVDDNRDAADSAADMLALFGYEARACYDGSAALLLADSFRPDACLIDLNMPGMDGDELAIRLREWAGGGPLLLVAVTAVSDEAGRRRNRAHSLEQRLARWLLEVRDRLGPDGVEVSHEFVSQMLGVRRAGVTETATALQARGLIECGRKNLRVTDPEALERVACGCFRVLLDEYDRLLGPMLKPGG